MSQRHAIGSTLESLNAAHKEQLESERRYRALFDACSDVILVHRFDEDGRPGQIVEVNEAACLGLGYSRTQLLSMTAEDVLAPESRNQVRERAHALADAGTLAYETVQITSDRQRMPVEVTARVVDIGGRRLCLTVSHSIAAHKELEEFLRSLTDVDELTGLLNRRGFFVKVDEIRRKARRGDRQVLITYFDVDGLKRVNDELGHAEGDKLLVAAADVLRTAFREQDVVARLGGDEFVALAMLGRRHDEALDRQTIAQRLEQAVQAKREETGRGVRLLRQPRLDGGQPPRAVPHRRTARPRRRADVRGQARSPARSRPRHVFLTAARAGAPPGCARLPGDDRRCGHPRCPGTSGVDRTYPHDPAHPGHRRRPAAP